MPDLTILGCLITLSILTEATVQIFVLDTAPLKKFVSKFEYDPETRNSRLRWFSAIIGVLYAFNMGVDIFPCLGYTSKLPYVGTIASGLIASRGSNYVHDFITSYLNKDKETII